MIKRRLKNEFIKLIGASIIFVITALILSNDNIYNKYSDYLFKSSIDFSYIKSKTNFIIGNILGEKDKFVSSEKLIYSDIKNKEDGYVLSVDNNYVINALESGVVTYVGNNDVIGNNVVIDGDNGTSYTYGYLDNINVNMYDYIDHGKVIGNTLEDKLYLSFYKNGIFEDYENYI